MELVNIFQYNKIILSIYQHNDITKLQKTFLDEVRKLISFDFAMFDFADTLTSKQVHFFSPVFIGFSKQQMDDYYDKYQYLDYTTWVLTQHHQNAYKDTDIVDNQFRESSKIFKEWLAPIGIYYGGGIIIEHDKILLGTVTFFKTKDNGDFTDGDVAIWELLSEHLNFKFSLLFPVGLKKRSDITIPYSDYRIKYNLTQRETEVLKFIIQGYSNIQIANELFIALSTVKKHTNKIYQKTGLKSRTEIIKTL